jgi:hypothetical protein
LVSGVLRHHRAALRDRFGHYHAQHEFFNYLNNIDVRGGTAAVYRDARGGHLKDAARASLPGARPQHNWASARMGTHRRAKRANLFATDTAPVRGNGGARRRRKDPAHAVLTLQAEYGNIDNPVQKRV